MTAHEPPQPQLIRVRTWQEANERLQQILGTTGALLGSGSSYPAPFAYFYKDALSGDGMGYRVYTTKEKHLDRLIATIEITGGPALSSVPTPPLRTSPRVRRR